MNPGAVLLYLALLSAVAAACLFAPVFRGRPPVRGAAAAFVVHAAALVTAMALLAAYFIGHHFEFVYVSQYSSRALSPALSIAASWAGQEGSILLWVTLGALLGLALLRQPGNLARPGLFFVALMQIGLMALLLIRNPFRTGAVVATDGQGLNPLLEDPWMVAHPPILFLGYAALVVPFALALAALARRTYDDFGRMVWPWTLFAVVTLGAGIGMGGVWAYKVLGWGGYWGWDPVENASLVPWLVGVALLHGLLLERTTGSVLRTNLVLALVGWATVVGGTYLTRSGVLQDFSVHSFADSGLNAPLVSFLLSVTLLPAALLVARWRSLSRAAMNWTEVNRGSALWLGLMTVLVLAALVSVGTTAPLLTTLFGKPASVEPRFYSVILLPLGSALLILMALAPALRWTRQEGRGWLALFAPGLAGGLVVAVGAALAGFKTPSSLIVAGFTGLALGVNAWMAVRLFRRGWEYGSGYLGHVGVSLMALGMVVSGTLARTERAQLVEGVPTAVLGHTLTYRGQGIGPRGERLLTIDVVGKSYRFTARPRLLQSMRGEGMVRTPAIDGWRELYLSPIEVREPATPAAVDPQASAVAGEASVVWLAKGEETERAGVRLRFDGFRLIPGQEFMTVFADLSVRNGPRPGMVSPGLRVGPGGKQAVPADLHGVGAVTIAKIDADRGRVALILPNGAGEPAPAYGAVATGSDGAPSATPPPAGVAFVELSWKPFVNLVWVGALLTLVGAGLAGLRRARVGAGRPSVPRKAEPAPAAVS